MVSVQSASSAIRAEKLEINQKQVHSFCPNPDFSLAALPPTAASPVDRASLTTAAGQARTQVSLSETSLEDIRAGQVIGLGDSGPAVARLQELLTKAGYPVQINGQFGPTTEALVRRFQKDTGLQVNGQLGPTTLKMLENPLRETAFGRRLAQVGRREALSMGRYTSQGQCYSGVADSLQSVGVKVTGLSAYMAANQLARNSRFREVKLPATSLPKLPAGAVVVWDRSPSPSLRQRGHGWEHGHISIADGKGREMSDYIDAQRTNYYVSNKFRVFLPK